MAGEYRLEGLAVPDTLDLLHELLERVGREHPEVLAEDLMLLETAVIELAGNVVEHGGSSGEVAYTFALEVHADELEARLEDSGEQVPSSSTDMPDEWSEDGRGIPLARLTLHELEYERLGERNAWRLVRRRRPTSSP